MLQPKNYARLGIEPRPHGSIPGALPLSYLAFGNHTWIASLCHLTSGSDPVKCPSLDMCPLFLLIFGKSVEAFSGFQCTKDVDL